jgi:hypothetical protein
MSEATLPVWLCLDCVLYNSVEHHTACYKCGKARGDGFNLQTIGIGTPAIVELLDVMARDAKRGKGKSKQRGNKVVAFGHVFDSKIEYERFLFLRDCEAEGLISSLQVHPTFTLAPKVTLPANAYRPKKSVQGAITYTPDFAYVAGGIQVYEDTKGAYGNSEKNKRNKKAGKPIVTEAARLRHKLFIAYLASTGKDFHFRLVTSPTLETIYVEKRKAA